MKPANNLASSRAASFFSVFFLQLFSTPEAAIIRRLGSHPGLAGLGEGLHNPRRALELLFSKHHGWDCGCSALLPSVRAAEARPLRENKAWRTALKLAERQCRGVGYIPGRTGARQRSLRTALEGAGALRMEQGAGPIVTKARRWEPRNAGRLGCLGARLEPDVWCSRWPKGLRPFPIVQDRFSKVRLHGESILCWVIGRLNRSECLALVSSA